MEHRGIGLRNATSYTGLDGCNTYAYENFTECGGAGFCVHSTGAWGASIQRIRIDTWSFGPSVCTLVTGIDGNARTLVFSFSCSRARW